MRSATTLAWRWSPGTFAFIRKPLLLLVVVVGWMLCTAGQAPAQTITNPGFETGSESGWLAGGAIHGVSAAAAHSGTYGQYNNGGWNSVFQNVSGFTTSSAYTVTVWARLSSAVSGNNQSLYISQDGGTTRTRQWITSTSWTQFTFNFTTGTNTSVQIGNEEVNGSSAVAYVDDWTVARSTGGGLPAGWSDLDIGGPTPAGSGSYSSGTYTIKGGGADIWGASDQFNYAYQSVSGDQTIVAKVATVQATDGWAKAGVMMRSGTAANAMYAAAQVTPGNGVRFQWRSSAGGSAADAAGPGSTAPYWVKMVRAGNSFSAYASSDGNTWTQIGTTQTIAMAASYVAGLQVTSHLQGTLNTSTFTNVSVTAGGGGSAPPTPTGLSASAGNAQITLSWNASSGATSYNLYRATTSGGEGTTAYKTGLSSTSYTDTGLTNGTTYYYKVAAVNSYGTSAQSSEANGTPQAPTVTSAALNGMNIGNCTDYETTRMFADVMKTSRNWQNTSGTDLTASQLDSNGWPNQDAQVVPFAGIANMHGTYALSFNGQATVTLPWGGTVSTPSYNSSTNTTTATLTLTGSGSMNFQMRFTNTKKTSTSATNTGISNVKLMRPTTPGGTTPYSSSTVYTTQYLNALTKYSTLRFMDFLATNSNPQVNWSDRTKPTQASFQVGNPSIPAGGWEGRGGSWEHVVLLANATGKDIWINIPCQATDDYITKVAQLLRYGSDGTNPYTSTQASPVWPPLNSNIKVYIEFSNEVWNTAGAFLQSSQNYNAAQANPSPMNFDGDSNTWELAWRRVAVRTVQISNTFRSVWGDANMMTRIRPVLAAQLGYADGPGRNGMTMLESYYNNSTYVTTPRHPSYYIYGFGGSAYYNCDSNATTVDQVLNTLPTAGFATAVQADTNYAKGFGLQHVSYEGGPSLDNTGNTTFDNLCDAAWRDSRMAGRLQVGFDTFQQNGGDLLMHFTITGDHQWGFTPDILTTSWPKLSGIDLINGESSRPAATYGTAVPATLTGNTFKAPPSWQYSNTNMTNKAWVLYIFRVTSARSFSITASTSGSGTAEICVDQTNLGTFNAGSGISAGSITLQPGIHGIKVKAMSGTFTVNSMGVN